MEKGGCERARSKRTPADERSFLFDDFCREILRDEGFGSSKTLYSHYSNRDGCKEDDRRGKRARLNFRFYSL